jgi:hypothetical protein
MGWFMTQGVRLLPRVADRASVAIAFGAPVAVGVIFGI